MKMATEASGWERDRAMAMGPGCSSPLSGYTDSDPPVVDARRSRERRSVAVDGIRHVAGTEVVDYPLRGVPLPLTATACFGIATVDCGLAQPLMGSCTQGEASCLLATTVCRATRCWPV